MNRREINPPLNSVSNKIYTFDLSTLGNSTFITNRSCKRFSIDLSVIRDPVREKRSEINKPHEDKKLSSLESFSNNVNIINSTNFSSKNNEEDACKYVNKHVVRTIKCWSDLRNNPGMNYRIGDFNLPLITQISTNGGDTEKKPNINSNHVYKYSCYNLLY